jgi:hypothetical protein
LESPKQTTAALKQNARESVCLKVCVELTI